MSTPRNAETPVAVTADELDWEARYLVNAYLNKIQVEWNRTGRWDLDPADYPAGRNILVASPQLQVRIILVILTFAGSGLGQTTLPATLCARDLPWTQPDLEQMLKLLVATPGYALRSWSNTSRLIERFLEEGNALTPQMARSIRALCARLLQQRSMETREMAERFRRTLGEDSLLPDPGETWADAACADICALPAEAKLAWGQILACAQKSDAGKPTNAWRKTAAGSRAASRLRSSASIRAM